MQNHSKLSVITREFTIKSYHGLSEASFEHYQMGEKHDENRLKENLYAIKSMMKPLGLGY